MSTQLPKRSDYDSFAAYREAYNKYDHARLKEKHAAEKARITSELENDKERAQAFRKELNALLTKHNVSITEASDDDSDWFGITGFYLGFQFNGCLVVWELDD